MLLFTVTNRKVWADLVSAERQRHLESLQHVGQYSLSHANKRAGFWFETGTSRRLSREQYIRMYAHV